MRAVVYSAYGSTDGLALREVPEPTVGDDEVLVRVRASSVNSWDVDLVRGTPFIVRLGAWRRPRYPVLGADVAGVVEAVGRSVTGVQPGDEVYGDVSGCSWGGFAELATARADVLAPKPAGLSFEEAAAVPQAGVLALQGLRKAQVGRGSRVLVNGAGGGVGTFAVQLAVSLGARVTGVDSAGKLDLVRGLGAERVLDYAQVDVTRGPERYDAVVDVAAYRSAGDYARMLNRGGTYVAIGGSLASMAQVAVLSPWVSRRHGKRLRVLAHRPSRADLVALTASIDSGAVGPVIDRCYPLAEVAAAVQYVGEGRARGKVVITV